MSFDMKAWLDRNVVAALLAGRQHKLTIHSFIKGSDQHDVVGMIVVWLESKDFGPDLLGLLEIPGTNLDYLRYPMKVSASGSEITLFGGDGMPTIGQRRAAPGAPPAALAMARLLRKQVGEPDLVIELFTMGTPAAAIVDVRAFYDLAKERHGVDPTGVMARWRPQAPA